MTTRRTLERVARALLTPEERGYALHVYPPGTPPGACPACGSTDGTRVSCTAVDVEREGIRVYVWRCAVCEMVSVSERKEG